MKDYIVTLFDMAQSCHGGPLVVVKVAQASAERAGMRLEDWVRQQLNGA